MQRKINPNGVNVEKWVIFTILLNLVILDCTTGVLEYIMMQNWVFILIAVLRIATLLIGTYSVAKNQSTIIW